MTTTQQHELRAAHVAAHINDFGKAADLAWPEINAAIKLALAILDRGKSAATAYEIGMNAIRAIAASTDCLALNANNQTLH